MSPGRADDIEFADDIELLDVAEPASVHASDAISSPPSRWNGLLAVAVIGIVGLVVVGLGGGDPSDDTPQVAPSTTSAPVDTTSPDPVVPSTTDDGPIAIPALEIGEGPNLSWQLVRDDTAASDFRWVDGRFVGFDGERSIAVVPGLGGPAVSVELVPFDGPQVRSLSSAVGDADLASRIYFLDQFAAGFQWPPRDVRIDSSFAPISDLVTRRIDLAAELLGNDVLVLQTASGTLDADAFRARTGVTLDPIFGIDVSPTTITVFGSESEEDIAIIDSDLSEEDLQALRSIVVPVTDLSFGPLGGFANPVDAGLARTDWIGVSGDEFIVGGTELRRSSNGITWERTGDQTPRFGGLLPPNPDGLLLGLGFDADEGYATLSDDAGRSWRRLPRPFQNTWRLTVADEVMAMTGWADSSFLSAPDDWTVLTSEVELQVGSDNNTFELRDRQGNTLLSGTTGDPSSGFRFAPGSPDFWFVDPDTGDEIARVPQRLFGSSLAAAQTRDGNPQLIAFTDITRAGSAQEWSLAPVDEVFGPEALSVEFVAGDGWLLASVITTDGRELHVAETSS